MFDIQDVGARFYTYISTMQYVMEACAENRKQLVITDRPNPCDYVDGPVRQKNQKSFVGMHAIPILHGCTVGELAQMINGEGWLPNGKKCALTVIPVEGWKHGQPYSLPVKPSPNLPNDQQLPYILHSARLKVQPSVWAEVLFILSSNRFTGYPHLLLFFQTGSLGRL